VTQSQEHCIGIDATTGKLLWKIPFSTAYTQNIVTPAVHEGFLIFSGLDNGIFAVRVVHRDGRWSTEKVWENNRFSMYMSSPVLVGDLLFGLSHQRRGQFFCLDARTGTVHWVSEGRQGDNAAILSAGNVLFLLKNDAELIIAKAGKERFEVVRQYSVAESPTWAHPVVLGNRVLIKDKSTLALWTLE
jgi:outer membrane protein assembly factor BamB